MSINKIMHFANATLQGQFRKYSSIISQVAVECVASSSSIEEATDKFNTINLAVARILCTESIEDIGENTPEILSYAQILNAFIDIEKYWNGYCENPRNWK